MGPLPQARGSRELVRGSEIGRYRIVERLARGGMAEVYLAHENSGRGVERLVALKLILPHMAGEPQFLSMFVNEVKVAASLHHPNIAQVFDFGEFDGEPYLAMELVHGATIQHLLRRAAERKIAIPLGCALAIAIAACAGLHYAHERVDIGGAPMHIVHRDVAPSNLMCRHDGGVKLLDFGIAKVASQTTATATGVFKGKAGYMSPEQCSDEALDRRSDVFNLGILLYELTTMRRAFFGDNPVAVLNKIAHVRFARPSEVAQEYPAELEAIVMRAMSLAPDDRQPTAQALQLELEAFARAQQLDHSTVALASLMHELYGEQPYPALPREPTVVPLAVVSADGAVSQRTTSPMLVRPRARARARRLPLVGAVAAIGVLSWLAWPRGEAHTQGEVPELEQGAQEQASPPEQASHVVSIPAAAPARAEQPAIALPPVDPSTSQAKLEAAPAVPERRTSSTKARRKKSTKPAKRSGPAGMYP
jgi:serine/threonine protein kinase